MNKTKKIICLQGNPNTGKSYTIIKLWEMILRNYKDDKEDDYVQLFVDSDDYDFVGIITSVNGHKIGINSRGDEAGWIERWNKKLVENNCDIIFCTCHSRGKTVDAVKLFSKNGYKIVFIPKKAIDEEKLQVKTKLKQAAELLEFCNKK